jgi:hypothetical protein
MPWRVVCAACGWHRETDDAAEARTWQESHRRVRPDHEVHIVGTSGPEILSALDTTRPVWCAVCADEQCGWEIRARTQDAAQDFKAVHLREHPTHRVTVVRF